MHKSIRSAIPVIILAVFMAFGCQWLLNKMGFFYLGNVNISEVRKSRSQMLYLSVDLQKLFMAYESAVGDFLKHPDAAEKNAMLAVSKKLNEKIDELQPYYGLPFARATRVFKIWQHNFQHKILKSSATAKDQDWAHNLDKIEMRIMEAESSERKDHELFLAGLLLDGDLGTKKPDSEIKGQIEKNINEKLIKDAENFLKVSDPQKYSCLQLMSPSGSVNDPKYVARQIADIQFQSRYCPSTIQSKDEEHCNSIKYIPPYQKAILNEGLAFCEIANDRLQKEADEANRKFGNMTFGEYVDKYVNPLVSKYSNKYRATGSEPKLSALPIVAFRNPEIDAQLAAYAEVGIDSD